MQIFSPNRPFGPFLSTIHHVRVFVCVFVCSLQCKTSTSGSQNKFWSKIFASNLASDDTRFEKFPLWWFFFFNLWLKMVVNQSKLRHNMTNYFFLFISSTSRHCFIVKSKAFLINKACQTVEPKKLTRNMYKNIYCGILGADGYILMIFFFIIRAQKNSSSFSFFFCFENTV